jgi:hypothetical protein
MKKPVKNEGQIQYSDRENVTPEMCLEFWKKERQLYLDGLETKIKYSGVDAGVYINNKIKELETLVKRKS